MLTLELLEAVDGWVAQRRLPEESLVSVEFCVERLAQTHHLSPLQMRLRMNPYIQSAWFLEDNFWEEGGNLFSSDFLDGLLAALIWIEAAFLLANLPPIIVGLLKETCLPLRQPVDDLIFKLDQVAGRESIQSPFRQKLVYSVLEKVRVFHLRLHRHLYT